jgi:hypothetical protein
MPVKMLVVANGGSGQESRKSIEKFMRRLHEAVKLTLI